MEVWALTGATALREALGPRSPYTRDRRHWADLAEGRVDAAHPVAAMVDVDNMLTADGPEHRRLRGLADQAFRPGAVDALRPRLQSAARRLASGLPEHCDLVADYAQPMAMHAFEALLGTDPTDRDRLRSMVGAVFAAQADPAATARAEAETYLDGLIKAKRAHPGEDVTSGLIAAHDTGDALTATELRGTLWLLVTAGFATTSAALVGAVELLLNRPDQRRRAATAGWRNTAQEALRAAPSVATLPYLFATRDVDYGPAGTVRAGEAVLLGFAAANHDLAAGAFDVDRPWTAHLAFGHGPHRCLGEHVARAVMETALDALFTRHPRIRAEEGEVPRMESPFLSGPARLTARLVPTDERP
ncbi:cytochrome P450 [Nocardiopsis coralliicola]